MLTSLKLKSAKYWLLPLVVCTSMPILSMIAPMPQKAQALCAATTQLTGKWQANDGGTYYIRQRGNQVWWVGMSSDQGKTWTNVFHGTRNGNTITGTWSDVPKGQILSGGNMSLTVQTSGSAILGLKKGSFTGGFGGSKWYQSCDDVILNPVNE